MKTIIIYLVFTLQIASVYGQTYRYLVRFKDKNVSPYTISNPSAFLSQKAIERRNRQGILVNESDFPPNPTYIDGVKNTGASIRFKTRWLNGVMVDANDTQKNDILALPYVAGVEFNKPLKQLRAKSQLNKFVIEEEQTLNYGDATAQITLLGVDAMHNAGFHGENMLIAILDNGFLNANALTCLDSAFIKNRVLEVYDFVDKDSTVFSQGGHGTNVMSCMAGYVNNTLIAPAYAAKFVLFRTEDDASETKAEEANWLFAAERADSLGVDIINSSLGYAAFDNPVDDYLPSQMNGNIALSTRAADLAVSKGMVVVCSAGNAGTSYWHVITAPSDGDSVLAVGAVNRNGQVASFSSRGILGGAVKPDVMAVGSQTALCTTSGSTGTGNGTSFASPLTAAMIAGFWQANKHLTAYDVIQCIRKSGHIYQTPNVDYGYGYANFVRADSVAKSQFAIKAIQPISNVIKSIKILPDNKSKMEVLFDTSFLGHQLRISFIDMDNSLIISQKQLVLNNINYTDILPFNTLSKSIVCRIDDIGTAQNLVIFKF